MNEETLFQEVLSRSREDRAAFLEQACEGRPELLAAVKELLAAHEKSGNILDRPPTAEGQPRETDLATAIAGFQLAHGLKPDGKAGPMTLMQLNPLIGVEEPRLETGHQK